MITSSEVKYGTKEYWEREVEIKKKIVELTAKGFASDVEDNKYIDPIDYKISIRILNDAVNNLEWAIDNYNKKPEEEDN